MRGANELGLTITSCTRQQFPLQPLIRAVALVAKKGCRVYYDILRCKINCKSVTISAENKWHEKLGTLLSTDLWNSSWKILAMSRVENKVKWLQTKILKGVVATNRQVNKFVQNVSPRCSFGCESEESTIHLFFQCPIIKALWEELQAFLIPAAVLNITKIKILFGDNLGGFNTKENYLTLLTKWFIWRERCAKRTPNFNSLRTYLNIYIKNSHISAKLHGQSDAFYNFWGAVLDALDTNITELENAAISDQF